MRQWFTYHQNRPYRLDTHPKPPRSNTAGPITQGKAKRKPVIKRKRFNKK